MVSLGLHGARNFLKHVLVYYLGGKARMLTQKLSVFDGLNGMCVHRRWQPKLRGRQLSLLKW